MSETSRDDSSRNLEEAYLGHKVYDRDGDKVGKVDDLFVDESGREEYLGVKMGLLGTKTTLLPMEIVRVDEESKRVDILAEKEQVKDGPAFDPDEEITPELEDRVRAHYDLGSAADEHATDEETGERTEDEHATSEHATGERATGENTGGERTTGDERTGDGERRSYEPHHDEEERGGDEDRVRVRRRSGDSGNQARIRHRSGDTADRTEDRDDPS